jgi:uncharacterized protein (DUF362 family)
VAIKPNLTFPVYRRGVMTNPEAIEALVVHLKDLGCRVTICESDSGGYNRFSMTEVFRATGISDLASRYGVGLVNLSGLPARNIAVSAGLRRLRVPLPVLLLDETDLFITMPVPKVHANTVISGAIKNQWGVIQEPGLRLKLHPYFQHVIYAVNKALPATVAITDGKYGLNRNGPMRGQAVELDWLMLCDNVFASDLVMSDLMGISWLSVPHLRSCCRKEGLPPIERMEFSQDWQPFRKFRFELHREWTDLPGFATFHSRVLAYIGYESALATPLHWLLYRFREPFY